MYNELNKYIWLEDIEMFYKAQTISKISLDLTGPKKSLLSIQNLYKVWDEVQPNNDYVIIQSQFQKKQDFNIKK